MFRFSDTTSATSTMKTQQLTWSHYLANMDNWARWQTSSRFDFKSSLDLFEIWHGTFLRVTFSKFETRVQSLMKLCSYFSACSVRGNKKYKYKHHVSGKARWVLPGVRGTWRRVSQQLAPLWTSPWMVSFCSLLKQRFSDGQFFSLFVAAMLFGLSVVLFTSMLQQ